MEKKTPRSEVTYRDTLDTISKQRYDNKLALIGNEDPYTLPKERWSQDVDKWAGVTYPDISFFLLYTASAYTHEEIKSYKGLAAYNQFVNGWVRDVKVCEINGVCLHTARVMHSQRLNEKPLAPWVIIQTDGKVLAAHCNCMAGLGEACTHIAAMLFSIEATFKVRQARTVTETKAYWLPASVKGVKYAKIKDIDFTSAKSKKKNLDAQFSDTPSSKRGIMQHKQVEPPTDEEIRGFLQKLSQTGAQSAILTVKQAFQAPFVPKVLDEQFPKMLTELLRQDMLQSSFSDILKYCEDINVKVSKEEAESVEKATRQQAQSKLWNRFRSGRITASRMYSVCHSSPAAPSESLIKAVCNPESAKFTSTATSWGCTHEKVARETYNEALQTLHDNFAVEAVGLTLNPDFPLFGASPDGTVSCDCCGEGVVEIKCPYCVRSSSLDMYTGASSCLEETDGERKTLKKQHPYYYQVQTQIHLCGKEYADFVVWTEREVHIERIEPDNELWEEIKEKAASFHAMAIMPELVGKFYSRINTAPLLSLRNDGESNLADANRQDIYCFCQQGETDTMVACDNQNCNYQWFHLSCLKLTKSKLPKGKWFCPDCSRLPGNRRKKGVTKKRKEQ
ncbi:uncharacterized protein LOC117332971 [Pecten maximus]|uniref:uncharacterized protein LOC117332971 n=1 Tax=Pecten maximus TaxID=6579 RepID=UPI0014588968|nr:uncharacterized protein LOC117332971 [Pecten maximus]